MMGFSPRQVRILVVAAVIWAVANVVTVVVRVVELV